MKDEAWAVTTNSDLTEGRGHEIVRFVCQIEATALRLASGINVQGSNGVVSRVELLIVDNKLYGPVSLVIPTKDDLKAQQARDAARNAEAKALAAGLTAQDIEAIRSGKVRNCPERDCT